METILHNNLVLTLNKLYQPLQIVTLKKALKSIVSGRAEIVNVEENSYVSYDINSWMEISELKYMIEEENDDINWIGSFQIPRVIRYLDYTKINYTKIKFTRKNVFTRDNFTCLYCGYKPNDIKELQLEHIIPKSRGGKTTWTNTVCSCYKCNTKKGDKTPQEAGMKLMRKPFKPKVLAPNKIRIKDDRYSCWENFVSNLYWNTELKS